MRCTQLSEVADRHVCKPCDPWCLFARLSSQPITAEVCLPGSKAAAAAAAAAAAVAVDAESDEEDWDMSKSKGGTVVA